VRKAKLDGPRFCCRTDFITRNWERTKTARKPARKPAIAAVGKAKAMGRCLTTRFMDAAEAEKAGQVARVIPADQLLEETLKAAQTIAGFSLPVVVMVKESVNLAFESSLNEGLLFERRAFHASFGLEEAWPPSSRSAKRTSGTTDRGDFESSPNCRLTAEPASSAALNRWFWPCLITKRVRSAACKVGENPRQET
jgi:Enoyl-CoA hydratase/isomerase